MSSHESLPQRLANSASFWGFVNTCCVIAAGVITIPIVVRQLSPDALGIWYTLYALTYLALLVSSGGLTPTAQRFASYLQAGAQTIQAQGVPDMSPKARPNLEGLAQLRTSTRRLLLLIGCGGMTMAAIIGGGLIIHAGVAGGLAQQAWMALGLQLLSIGLQALVAGDCAIAQGMGGLAYMQRVMALARLCYAITLIGGLVGGLGLLSLGLSGIVMAGLQGAGAYRFLRRHLPRSPVDAARARSGFQADFAALWPTTWRFCLVGLGAWLITTSGTVMAGFLLGLAEAGRYGIAIQLFAACGSIAGVWITMAVPTFCTLRTQQRFEELRRLFLARSKLAIATFALGACAIVLLAPPLLSLVSPHASLPTAGVLLAMAIIYLLEFHHGSIWATLLMTANEVPFLNAALLSGIGVLICSALLTSILGIWGFVLGQGLVQAAYNNWRWPVLGYRSLYGRP